MARVHTEIQVDAEGRFAPLARPAGQRAEKLPNVKVRVCRDCNSGWMSARESDVQRALGPFLFQSRAVRLSSADVSRIAAWAVKTWMAYALNLGQLQNPFSRAEYRSFAATPLAMGRAHIWMASAHDPRAQVAAGLQPTMNRPGSSGGSQTSEG